MKTGFAFTLAALLLAGCATTPIKPLYVSPDKYQAMNCTQLGMEADRVTRYLKQGVEVPAQRSTGFAIGLGGWNWGGGGWGINPSVTLGGNRSQVTERTEMARLLGERDAIVQAGRFKGCKVTVEGEATASTS